MSEDTLEVWLTRRALVAGLEKVLVKRSRLGPGFVVNAQGKGEVYVLGQQAHLQRSEAVAAAEAERARRIRSLQDQIGRIARLDFGGEDS